MECDGDLQVWASDSETHVQFIQSTDSSSGRHQHVSTKPPQPPEIGSSTVSAVAGGLGFRPELSGVLLNSIQSWDVFDSLGRLGRPHVHKGKQGFHSESNRDKNAQPAQAMRQRAFSSSNKGSDMQYSQAAGPIAQTPRQSGNPSVSWVRGPAAGWVHGLRSHVQHDAHHRRLVHRDGQADADSQQVHTAKQEVRKWATEQLATAQQRLQNELDVKVLDLVQAKQAALAGSQALRTQVLQAMEQLQQTLARIDDEQQQVEGVFETCCQEMMEEVASLLSGVQHQLKKESRIRLQRRLQDGVMTTAGSRELEQPPAAAHPPSTTQ